MITEQKGKSLSLSTTVNIDAIDDMNLSDSLKRMFEALNISFEGVHHIIYDAIDINK